MGRNEFITIGAFHKEIKNPIEEVQFSTSTFVFETTFINSPKAVLSGAELEYRTRFDMPISNPMVRRPRLAVLRQLHLHLFRGAGGGR
jgi:hypothetical protein